ncbi:Signal transduction histidine kinase [Saccharopolyspora kobensis]|uniref:histidine kinase n=1 Tax=Saccharopolyspora kobensis TaxID=146035 RepID=A0A1H6C0X1_9PSEU|nr:Signal transduction histidine kinase [Saccharopolyspora kobensis]SFC23511.1 Signal transduction histidine kinase [Saccharopolyspora kobensis]
MPVVGAEGGREPQWIADLVLEEEVRAPAGGYVGAVRTSTTDHRFLVDGSVSVLCGAVVGAASLSTVRDADPAVAAAVIAILVGLTGCLAVRRIRPTGAFVVGSALMLGLVALPNIGEQGVPPILLPFSLIHPVLLYAVVAYTERSALPVACGLLGAGISVVRGVIGFPFDPLGTAGVLATAAFGSVLAAWALGRYQRIRVAYVRSLEERAAQAELLREQQVREATAAERRLIAREIHDVAAHSLAVVLAQADTARLVFDRDPEKAREMIGTAVEVGRQAMGELRSMLGVLRTGDEPAPADGDLAELVETFRRAGAAVELVSSGTEREIDTAQRHAVYRIVQESVTNALKHVGPEVTCRVVLDWAADRLTVTVSDDGPGTSADLAAGGGFGIAGMAERMRQIGGDFDVRSAPGGGTEVRAGFGLPGAPR